MDLDNQVIGSKETEIEVALKSYVSESDEARRSRMEQNKLNFEMYNMNQDFSHKVEGQSKEFIPKTFIAVEQLTANLLQGIFDTKKWFSTSSSKKAADDELNDDDVWKILDYRIRQMKFSTTLADALKSGFIGSLVILKLHGYKKKRLDQVEEVEGKIKKVYKNFRDSCFKTIRQEDFFIDPTGSGLYLAEKMYLDHHVLIERAKEEPENYYMERILDLQSDEDSDEKAEKSRETGQDISSVNSRKRVAVYDFYGTVVNEKGEVLLRDINLLFDKNGKILSKPMPSPLWERENPYLFTGIIRVPNSVWHKALIDAPAALNKALNEMFNLILDSGLMATHGIKQVREDWLEDPSEIANGVTPGMTLRVNSNAPADGKVLQRVDTSTPNNEGPVVYNMTEREFNMAAFSNDLRMGSLPQRAVKATEIVASNQSINNVFSNIVLLFEEFTTELITMLWQDTAQNFSEMDLQAMEQIIGPDKLQKILTENNAQFYTKYVIGRKFQVFGISNAVNKIEDFRKYTALLSTISGIPKLAEEFQLKYSFSALIEEVIRALDIDTDKILASADEVQMGLKEKNLRILALERGIEEQAGNANPSNPGANDMLSGVRAQNLSGDGTGGGAL